MSTRGIIAGRSNFVLHGGARGRVEEPRFYTLLETAKLNDQNVYCFAAANEC